VGTLHMKDLALALVPTAASTDRSAA